MLAFALIAPLATTLDTLVFNDGMTHHLDGSQVSLADDIVVQGSGGTTQTTVFLVDDAQVAEASLFSHGTLGLRDQSYVAGDVTIHGPYALVHADDEATIGGTLHVAHGAATLAGHSTVGDVEVGLNASLNLNADATISGDLDGQGRVAFHRGRVLGTTTVSHYFPSREPRTEFVGPLITEGGLSMRLHDQRLGSSLTARGSSGIEISGESEVIGTLRAEDQASVTIFVVSVDVPTG